MNLSIIKKLRKEKGLSQKGLADLLNVSSAYIQQIECNKKNPSVSTLIKIASVLNVDLSTLINETDNKKSIDDIDLKNLIPVSNLNELSKNINNNISIPTIDLKTLIPISNLNELSKNINNNISIADKVDNIYLLENLYKDTLQHLKIDSITTDKLHEENRNLRLSLAYLDAQNKNLEKEVEHLKLLLKIEKGLTPINEVDKIDVI